MNVRNIILSLISLMVFTACSLLSSMQGKTILQGKVTDANTGEPILFGAVALYKNDILVNGTETNLDGNYYFSDLDPETYDVEASYVGYNAQRVSGVVISAGKSNKVDLTISEGNALEEVIIIGHKVPLIQMDNTTQGVTITQDQISRISSTTAGAKNQNNINIRGYRKSNPNRITNSNPEEEARAHSYNNEDYGQIQENKFIQPEDQPLSTFSIDVDRAAYSNVRRFLNNGSLPPVDAVRIEEMINYFDYAYPQPTDGEPFAVHHTLTPCPWNASNHILHIGIQGQKIAKDKLPPSNLVFLIDVSGSMNSNNKLGLLKSAFRLLAQNLREEDRVAMVVYAGNAGLVLPSTAGSDQETIIAALNNLNAGGSTAGGAGIQLAYKVAKENFIEEGNNRIILATDGDFNVGASSDEEMVKLIESKRDDGIFISVLGFGMGNYKDKKMQEIADNGNGNHAYIDNIQEARKVMINEFGGTLHTIAKDVKIQIEFNPAQVAGYRLIGYENRMLAKEDFNDDKKDAGELGAGHVVTAMYEIITPDQESPYLSSVDKLKYQEVKKPSYSDDLATIKLRYKKPMGKKSKKIERIIENKISKNISPEVDFATSVAEFGLLLRNSPYKNTSSYNNIIARAKESKGEDEYGYRSEFIRLVENAKDLDNRDIAKK